MRLLGEKGIDQASLTATGAEKGRWEERRQGQHKLLAGHREEEEEEISLTSAIRSGWMGEVREGRKRRETVPVGKRSPNLKANLTLQKVTAPLLSANTRNQLANTRRTRWLITHPARAAEVCGMQLGWAALLAILAEVTVVPHGPESMGMGVFFLSFFCGEKKIAGNCVIKDYRGNTEKKQRSPSRAKI